MLQSRTQFIALLAITVLSVIIVSANGQNKAFKVLSVYNMDLSRLRWQEFDNAAKKIENNEDMSSSERDAVLKSKYHLNLANGHHWNVIGQSVKEYCTYANATLVSSVQLDNTLRERAQKHMDTFYNNILKKLGELLRELHSSSISICSTGSKQNPFKISIEAIDNTVSCDIIHGIPADLEHIFNQLVQQLKMPNQNPMPAHHSFRFIPVKKEIPYCRIQIFIESAIQMVDRVLNELAAMTDAAPTTAAIQQILSECKVFSKTNH